MIAYTVGWQVTVYVHQMFSRFPWVTVPLNIDRLKDHSSGYRNKMNAGVL